MLFSEIWILISRGSIGPLSFWMFVAFLEAVWDMTKHEPVLTSPHGKHCMISRWHCFVKRRSEPILYFVTKKILPEEALTSQDLGKLLKLGSCSTPLGGTPQLKFGKKTIKQTGWKVKLILRFSLLRVKTASKELVAKLVTLIVPTKASDDCLLPWLYIESLTVSEEVGRKGAPILMIYQLNTRACHRELCIVVTHILTETVQNLEEE